MEQENKAQNNIDNEQDILPNVPDSLRQGNHEPQKHYNELKELINATIPKEKKPENDARITEDFLERLIKYFIDKSKNSSLLFSKSYICMILFIEKNDELFEIITDLKNDFVNSEKLNLSLINKLLNIQNPVTLKHHDMQNIKSEYFPFNIQNCGIITIEKIEYQELSYKFLIFNK